MPSSDQAPLSESGTRNSYRRSPGFNWRGPVLIGIALIMIASALFFKGPDGYPDEKTPAETLRMIQAGDVICTKDRPVEVEISDQKELQYLTGYYKNHATQEYSRFRTALSPDWNKEIMDALAKAGIHPIPKAQTDRLASAVIGFLPITLFVLIILCFVRQALRR